MKILRVDLQERAYDIQIGPGLLDTAGEAVRGVCPKAKRAFLVTDSNVMPLYGKRVRQALDSAGFATTVTVIPAGETSKNAEQLTALWNGMAAAGLTRTDVVIALGGGVVGDLTGFAAATMLRGIDFVQLPTTLLAQVDSSVGGKVAIDLPAGKNLAGAFWQPKLVLMDPVVLDTLPDTTFSDGMAEVIKYGCIWDATFFEFLEQHVCRAEIMANIEHVLYTCCDIKREVVVEDERDTGLRMLLNFGHTLGHAYERAGNYETWTHGQAVAAGMAAVAQIGAALEIGPAELVKPIEKLVSAFGLPTHIECSAVDYRAALALDKKGAGDHVSLIVLDRIGHALAHKMDREALLALLG